MLTSRLLHPEMLETLARSGHGGQVLIADGNYPFSTRSNPAATRVFLNLAPGMVTVTDVLDVLLNAIPVEAADAMLMDGGMEPEIFADFRRLLPTNIEVAGRERFDFYSRCKSSDVCLVVATGEQRLYANILLTIGVVKP
jgi:L-fucose mutarotase